MQNNFENTEVCKINQENIMDMKQNFQQELFWEENEDQGLALKRVKFDNQHKKFQENDHFDNEITSLLNNQQQKNNLKKN